MRATQLVITIRHLPYAERLNALQLPTLNYRRFRGNMIEVHKILTGSYDSNIKTYNSFERMIFINIISL